MTYLEEEPQFGVTAEMDVLSEYLKRFYPNCPLCWYQFLKKKMICGGIFNPKYFGL